MGKYRKWQGDCEVLAKLYPNTTHIQIYSSFNSDRKCFSGLIHACNYCFVKEKPYLLQTRYILLFLTEKTYCLFLKGHSFLCHYTCLKPWNEHFSDCLFWYYKVSTDDKTISCVIKSIRNYTISDAIR